VELEHTQVLMAETGMVVLVVQVVALVLKTLLLAQAVLD
jgi:hypothetical protein